MAKRPVQHQLTPAAEAQTARRAVTLLVHDGRRPQDIPDHTAELNELATAAGLDVLATDIARVIRPHPARYLGAGTTATLATVIARCQARQLALNRDLGVTQMRNLESELGVAVTDRTDLILNIFSRRAQSREGQLQVELARCRRQLARLAGRWTHLERQRGGIGVRGGPGEKQMELDRRQLAERIRRLEGQINALSARQALARRRRRKNRIMTAALVGYTNAGKSSLFNLLTGAGVASDDRPFVTLDSTARRVRTSNGAYILSDTVGFIRDLPHDLIAGFRATLADTAESDLLLIVIDAARADWRDHLRLSDQILSDIGAADRRRILIFNKSDHPAACAAAAATTEWREHDKMRAVCTSCRTGHGVAHLQHLIAARAAAHESSQF